MPEQNIRPTPTCQDILVAFANPDGSGWCLEYSWNDIWWHRDYGGELRRGEAMRRFIQVVAESPGGSINPGDYP